MPLKNKTKQKLYQSFGIWVIQVTLVNEVWEWLIWDGGQIQQLSKKDIEGFNLFPKLEYSSIVRVMLNKKLMKSF